ncbi:hypothetical protein BC833DRAFT_546349, partial [Globomyces pollinis-pini]
MAWTKVVEEFSVYRTAFISTSDGIFQVVLKNVATPWIELENCNDESSFIRDTLLKDRKLGFSLTDECLVRFSYSINLSCNRTVLFFTHHHSIIDGWSIPITKDSLLQAYMKEPLKSGMSFKNHVKLIMNVDQDESSQFWKHAYAKIEKDMKSFPLLNALDTSKPTHSSISKTFPLENGILKRLLKRYGITMSTFIRAVWALVLKSYHRCDNIAFGTVVSGRDSGIENVERCVGLLINTVPVTVNAYNTLSISELFQNIQNFYISSLSHSHSNIMDIKKWNGYSSLDNLFETLLVYQNYPVGNVDSSNLPFTFTRIDGDERIEYPLSLIAESDDEIISFKLRYSPQSLTTEKANQVLHAIQTITERLLEGTYQSVEDVIELSGDARDYLMQLSRGPKVEVPYDCV